MSLIFLNYKLPTSRRWLISTSLLAIFLSFISAYGLTGCGDVSKTSAPAAAPAGPGALTITTTSLPDGTVNLPYAANMGASGGVTPYTWSVTPSLPANLTFDPNTGVINGTPAAQDNNSHTFTLQDSSSPPQTVQKSLSLTINTSPPVLSITTTSLPNGSVGQAYNQTVQATGGTGALTWNIVAGTLPQNLIINQTTGVISGTPNAAGPSSFTVGVADQAGQADTQALSILVNSPTPPNITTTTLPGGTVSQPYSQSLQATGGTGTLVWNLSGGSLPTNLALNSGGTISGTPTNTGTSNFTVKVTDAISQSDTQPLSIVVSALLTITTTSPLPNARIGKSYNQTLQHSGGVSPFTWSVTPALPAGLSLNASTGAITGTPGPLAGGTYTLTFTIQDSSTPKQTASTVLMLTVTL